MSSWAVEGEGQSPHSENSATLKVEGVRKCLLPSPLCLEGKPMPARPRVVFWWTHRAPDFHVIVYMANDSRKWRRICDLAHTSESLLSSRGLIVHLIDSAKAHWAPVVCQHNSRHVGHISELMIPVLVELIR